mgnify:CR=1 FL=1
MFDFGCLAWVTLISIARADGNGEWKSTFISNGSDKQIVNFITTPGSVVQQSSLCSIVGT